MGKYDIIFLDEEIAGTSLTTLNKVFRLRFTLKTMFFDLEIMFHI